MANPLVRSQLHFYPEDSGQFLGEAWQGSRWLHEMDPSLLTPMIRHEKTDYYVFEPVILTLNRLCIPFRWFKRNDRMYGLAWSLTPSTSPDGSPCWLVDKRQTFEFHESALLVPFPSIISTLPSRGKELIDPRKISGMQSL